MAGSACTVAMCIQVEVLQGQGGQQVPSNAGSPFGSCVLAPAALHAVCCQPPGQFQGLQQGWLLPALPREASCRVKSRARLLCTARPDVWHHSSLALSISCSSKQRQPAGAEHTHTARGLAPGLLLPWIRSRTGRWWMVSSAAPSRPPAGPRTRSNRAPFQLGPVACSGPAMIPHSSPSAAAAVYVRLLTTWPPPPSPLLAGNGSPRVAMTESPPSSPDSLPAQLMAAAEPCCPPRVIGPSPFSMLPPAFVAPSLAAPQPADSPPSTGPPSRDSRASHAAEAASAGSSGSEEGPPPLSSRTSSMGDLRAASDMGPVGEDAGAGAAVDAAVGAAAAQGSMAAVLAAEAAPAPTVEVEVEGARQLLPPGAPLAAQPPPQPAAPAPAPAPSPGLSSLPFVSRANTPSSLACSSGPPGLSRCSSSASSNEPPSPAHAVRHAASHATPAAQQAPSPSLSSLATWPGWDAGNAAPEGGCDRSSSTTSTRSGTATRSADGRSTSSSGGSRSAEAAAAMLGSRKQASGSSSPTASRHPGSVSARPHSPQHARGRRWLTTGAPLLAMLLAAAVVLRLGMTASELARELSAARAELAAADRHAADLEAVAQEGIHKLMAVVDWAGTQLDRMAAAELQQVRHARQVLAAEAAVMARMHAEAAAKLEAAGEAAAAKVSAAAEAAMHAQAAAAERSAAEHKAAAERAVAAIAAAQKEGLVQMQAAQLAAVEAVSARGELFMDLVAEEGTAAAAALQDQLAATVETLEVAAQEAREAAEAGKGAAEAGQPEEAAEEEAEQESSDAYSELEGRLDGMASRLDALQASVQGRG